MDIKKIKEKIDSEQVKKIISNYGFYPVYENENILIYPTICHNIDGGSHKLYYYKNSKLFVCYTECNSSFDIFELIQKMEKLRGFNITIFEAISKCGINTFDFFEEVNYNSIEQDINSLYSLLRTKNTEIKLNSLDQHILSRFIFDKNALSIWYKEGISYDTMIKYNIKYDPIENCIIIPNYDLDNNLISIRGRFFNDDGAKYKPIIFNNQLLSHPSALNLYGLNVNKNYIENIQKAIIFEGEKSVLKMDSIYGNKNYSVATLGKNISMQQINLLNKLKVKEVILAYDADYKTYQELKNKQLEYIKIAKTLKTFFNVSILFDYDRNKLDYKDSPIDKGKDIFEEILKQRLYI